MFLAACGGEPEVKEPTPTAPEPAPEPITLKEIESAINDATSELEAELKRTAQQTSKKVKELQLRIKELERKLEDKQPTPSTPDDTDTEPEPAPSVSFDPEIQEILDKVDAKVKSMQYNYLGPSDPGTGDIFFVKGNKINIHIQRPMELRDRPNYFDSVFLDTQAQSAIAFCMDVYGEHDCLERNKMFAVTFSEYIKPSPLDWVSDIEPTATITGEQQYSKRSVKRIDFQKGADSWMMLLDETYGVPLNVIITGADGSKQEYKYLHFTANSVVDADVTPPSS